jgi:hypothetical protein
MNWKQGSSSITDGREEETDKVQKRRQNLPSLSETHPPRSTLFVLLMHSMMDDRDNRQRKNVRPNGRRRTKE